ncbi:MAG: hypothetical protein HC920_14455 [Oscillatoriales cyanobacterium SM2_3_0]|nr:hypothetical protein [Oscillatoriales cyanobacterium SM2_3_0]
MNYILTLEDSNFDRFVLKPNGKYVTIDAFDEALIMDREAAKQRLELELSNPEIAKFSLGIIPFQGQSHFSHQSKKSKGYCIEGLIDFCRNIGFNRSKNHRLS